MTGLVNWLATRGGWIRVRVRVGVGVRVRVSVRVSVRINVSVGRIRPRLVKWKTNTI